MARRIVHPTDNKVIVYETLSAVTFWRTNRQLLDKRRRNEKLLHLICSDSIHHLSVINLKSSIYRHRPEITQQWFDRWLFSFHFSDLHYSQQTCVSLNEPIWTLNRLSVSEVLSHRQRISRKRKREICQSVLTSICPCFTEFFEGDK